MGVAAALSVKVTANVGDLEKQLANVQRSFGSWVGDLADEVVDLSGILGKVGDKLQDVGKKMTVGLTLPLGAVAGMAIKTGVEFERAMNSVRAVLAPTDAEFKALEATAIRMGQQTVFSATDSAQAMLELGKAGLTVQESIDATGPTLELAAASGLSMARAAEISARSMSAFGMEVADLPHLNDVLAKAVNASTLEIEDIATAFKYVGPIATGFGLSIEEVTASLALMRDAGIAAETTGRGLREGLGRLVNPVKATEDVMGELGIETFLDGSGQLMAFSEVIGLLEERGLTAAQSMRMFGDAAGPGMFALVQKGRAALDGMTTALENSDGTAKAMSEAMMAGLPGAIEQFKGSFETLQIIIKKDLEPIVSAIVKTASKVLDFFIELPAPVRIAGVAFAGFVAAAGPLLIILGSLVKSIALMSTLSGINTALNMLGGAAGTAARSTGLLGTVFATLSGWFTRLMGVIVPFITNLFSVGNVFRFVAGSVTGTLGLLAKFAGLIVGLVGWPAILAAGLTALALSFPAVRSVLGDILSILGSLLKLVVVLVKMGFEALIDSLKTVGGWFVNLGKWLYEVVPGAELLGGIFVTLTNKIGGFFSKMAEKLKQFAAFFKQFVTGLGLDSGESMQTWNRGGDVNLGKDVFAEGYWADPNAHLPAGGGGKGKTPMSEEAKKAAEEWQKTLDKLSGKADIADANEWLRKLAAIGGIAKLSAPDVAELHEAMTKALDASIRLGQAAPQSFYDLFLASSKWLPKVTDGLTHLKDEFKALEIGRPFADAMVPNIGLNPLGSVGTQMAMPGMPTNWVRKEGQFKDGKWMEGAWTDLAAPDGFMKKMFGDAKAFGAELSQTFVSALTGGGDAGKAVGALFGGTAFKNLFANGKNSGLFDVTKLFGDKGIGGAIGGALGAAMPIIGNMLGTLIGPLLNKIGGALKNLFDRNKGRDLVEDFASTFEGGFNGMHEQLLELGAKGEALWVKLTQGTGRNSPEQAKANIDAVTAALEQLKHRAEGLNEITAGVNARAAAFGEGGVTNQTDFNNLGTMAFAAFGAQVQQGGSPLAVLQTLKPTLDLITSAMQAHNFQASEMVMRLLDINGVVIANGPAFQALAADQQILNGMLKANWADMGLFAAASADVGLQLQALIDKGVPTAQALALNQPVLQSLWEAQKQFGFQTDEATQALLDQAVAQGIVGPQMRDVNKQILDVLVAIGKVLGADIPAALAGLPGAAEGAAKGMKDAFERNQPNVGVPSFGGADMYNPDGSGGFTGDGRPSQGDFGGQGFWNPYKNGPIVITDTTTGETRTYDGQLDPRYHYAQGGLVRARSGGTAVTVGEGGEDEYIVPRSKMGGGDSYHIGPNYGTVDEPFVRMILERIAGGGSLYSDARKVLK